jgi:hypothetical protein
MHPASDNNRSTIWSGALIWHWPAVDHCGFAPFKREQTIDAGNWQGWSSAVKAMCS